MMTEKLSRGGWEVEQGTSQGRCDRRREKVWVGYVRVNLGSPFDRGILHEGRK